MHSEPQRPPSYDSNPPEDATIWRCPNCGQLYFGDPPPDLCAVCDDFTTWRRVRRPDNAPDENRPPEECA